jgi:hypothetical protein
VIPTTPLILRFRIELQATDLLVWPKIEVPCDRLGSAGGVACAGL